jgi:hypothetical protein
VADNGAVDLRHQRDQRRDGAAQRIDDLRLLGAAERGTIEFVHGSDVTRPFSPDAHPVRR